MYWLLILLAISQTSLSARVDCPFNQNKCICLADISSPPNTFTRIMCNVCGDLVPFETTTQSLITNALNILSPTCDIQIPANAFSAFLTIDELSFTNVQQQNIQFHPNAFNETKISALSSLYFDGMLPIPAALSELGRNGLNTLVIESAFAKTLDDNQFQDFTNLTTLAIKSIEFESISKNAFVGLEQTLVNISLYNNKLTAYPDALNRLIKLQQIDLSDNQLSFIPRDLFSNLPALVSVNLEQNAITKLGIGDFAQNDKLVFLKLNGNPITTIDKLAFSPLTALQRLEINELSMETLDLSIFQDLQHLKLVKAATQKLKSLTVTDKVPMSLTYIDLSFDSIQVIDAKVADLLSHSDFELLDLSFSSNLICDENIQWMAKYVYCNPVRIDSVSASCGNLSKRLDDYLKETVANPCQ